MKENKELLIHDITECHNLFELENYWKLTRTMYHLDMLNTSDFDSVRSVYFEMYDKLACDYADY